MNLDFKTNYPDIFEANTTILDVGDTSGLLLESVNKKGTSLNINQECVDFIEKRGIKAILGNAEQIEIEDNSFDYCFCFQCLEHLLNPLAALKELGRIARKKVFLSIPYADNTNIYDVAYWQDLRKKSWGETDVRNVDCHVFEFSTKDLRKLLSYTDLEYENSFRMKFFDDSTLKNHLLNTRFASYFNFFVLNHRNGDK